MDAILNLGLEELSTAYRTRELSPVEVLKASLDRLEEVNPLINAVYYIDREAAFESARASEKRWEQQDPLSILDGVPTTTKDALTTTGMPGARGSAAELEQIAPFDHPAVARMREGGAVIMGKNTMSDYGMLAAGVSSRYGFTRNPWNLNCTTGASSSGAAASVAAGVEPVSIGTDIVGSIRVPASYCGLVGHKPSQGRVPYYFPSNPSLVAGPLARSVKDAAHHLTILAGQDRRDFSALPSLDLSYAAELKNFEPKKKSILVIKSLGMAEETAPDTLAALENAATEFSNMGVEVHYLESFPFFENEYASAETFYKTRCMAEISKRPVEDAKNSSVIWNWTRNVANLSAIEFYEAFNSMQLLREKAARLIWDHDYILLPTTPKPAFSADTPAPDPNKLFTPWVHTFLFNLTEQPATSVPFGVGEDGLPIGLQIVGNRFDDLGTLQMAACLEEFAPALGHPSGLNF